MKTVFYAWQSDLPNNTNRGFVEGCLERAIAIANDKRPKIERLVLDKDTQGESGMPVVAEVIFQKIASCAVFVPDLSFVTPVAPARAISNPNVLLELGYALRAIGDRRIVGLFNSAYGSTDDLPFDLRTRRFPLEYRLAEGDSKEVRQAVRDQIVKKLANALVMAADHAPAEPEIETDPTPSHAAAGLDDCSFVPPNSPQIAEVDSVGKDGLASEHVFWHHGPSAWLRVLPIKRLQLSRAQLGAVVDRAIAPPGSFGQAERTQYAKNRNGVVVLGFDGEKPDTLATRLTQVFLTGEIWGLNKALIEPQEAEPRRRFFIPWAATSEAFEQSLRDYLRFARESLKVELPVIVVAGLAMVNEALFVPPESRYREHPQRARCMENSINRRWTLDTFDVSPNELFHEFYAAIWDACGLDYEKEPAKHAWPK